VCVPVAPGWTVGTCAYPYIHTGYWHRIEKHMAATIQIHTTSKYCKPPLYHYTI